jgi:thioredoxin reductase (NADPH)
MRDALAPLQAELGFEVTYVDVDAESELEARFGELVPVLVAGDKQLCHYFLDQAAVRDHFLKIR